MGSWDSPAISHERITQEWCKLHLLINDLSQAQARLGTPLEKPNDCLLVQDLGHTIRNRLQIVQLWAEFGMIDRSDILLELEAS